ncbi:TetR/AcrR family transcriptional regulator [Paenibacillus sp. J5C_2022]|uniref:TetR/AcrR family transcriptional regulator n=1 Tax=Paenibacillus sp. J5C2022 TaxID=2977129 RepID=UPI0021D1132E|nr:TetR/AcrR family transcriptional regulator [Paenibacillus sp. J5C2022]MCU6710711.1 TetR/AcrR family transcriptional regulator [Paenibacillus sp. J5C2022]
MSGFERRKQMKMEQIFQASAQLFAKYGYEKVSVNEIAERASVSPATIYNYFGTKDRLYAAMVKGGMEKQLQQCESILQSKMSYREKTKAIMLLDAQSLQLLSEDASAADALRHHGVMTAMEEFYEEAIKPFYIRYLALGKQEGYIGSSLSEDMAIRYLRMFMNELGRQWSGDKSAFHSGSELDSMLELFFFGLAGQCED